MSCLPNAWPPIELSWFTAATSGFLGIISIAGNFIIIVIFAIDPLKKLRSPFNYFLVNLAVSDLIVGGFSMPISVWVYYQEATGYIHPTLAKLMHMSFLISASASLLSLISLSVDRLIAIRWAIKYRHYLSWNRCIITSCVLWLMSLSIPFVYFKWGLFSYLMFYANTSILVGLVVMTGIYLSVYRFLREKTERRNVRPNTDTSNLKKRIEKEQKVTQTLLVILIFFICTYIPTVIIIYVLRFCKSCDCTVRHIFRDSLYLILASNSCVNPFICTIRLKHFQKSIKAIFNRIRSVNVNPSTNNQDNG